MLSEALTPTRVGDSTRNPTRTQSPKAIRWKPLLEDRGSIQIAIGEVVKGARRRTIDPKRAGMLPYAMQIASGNAKHTEEIISSYAVSEITHSAEGEEMAPEGATAGPPQEPTLADLIVAEIRRGRALDEAGADQPSQTSPEEDFAENWQGMGVSAPWELPPAP